MLAIIQRIERCCAKLPVKGPVSSSVDPKPLVRLLKHIRRGIQLTEICLVFYDNGLAPEEPWKEWKDEAKTSRPWLSYESDTWQARLEHLRVVLINHYAQLSHPYSDYSPLAADRSKQYRPSELIYVLCGRLEMCMFKKRSVESRKRMASARATDLGYIRDNELAIDDSRVLSMPCSRVLDSLRHLFLRSVTICYSDQLELYWELLEHRLYRLVLYAHTEMDLDVKDFRQAPKAEASEKLLYFAHPKLLSIATLFSAAIHKRFYMARLFERLEYPQAYRREQDLVKAIYSWFLRKAKNMTSRQTSKSVRERTLESNLMAGEIEMYRFEFPRDDDGVMAILSRNRGEAFQKIVDSASRSVADIIEKDLPKINPGSPEPFLLQYALLEITEQTMKHTCEGASVFDHASLERDMDVQYEDLRRTDRPRMIQLFNHWQLLYKKQTIAYNSYLRALAAFVYYTYRDFQGKFSGRITMDEWAEDLCGRELFHTVLLGKASVPESNARKSLFSM